VIAVTTTETRPDTGQPADLAVILPDLHELAIAEVPARVKRIRTREVMLLARVLTAGLGASLTRIDIDEDGFDQQLMGLLLMAVPEAHEELIALIKAIVEPIDPFGQDDKAREQAFRAELDNPGIDVTLDVIGAVLAQERDTIPMLLGKARLLVGQVQALYRTGHKDT
jgi:hypothetical protein